jgi:arginase
MRDIDERSVSAIMRETLDEAFKDVDAIHLSFDLDGVDPLYAPGVSTPVTGGISYREAHLALEMLADTGKLCSIDMVELNPMTDEGHKTAHLAVELITSALGKSIV